MKTFLSPVLILTLFLFSCKKNRPAVSNNIMGGWQWQYSNSLDGDTIRPSASATVLLRLYIDSSYQLYLNDNAVSSGRFSTSTDVSSNITYISFSDYLAADKLWAGPSTAYFFDAQKLQFYSPIAPDVVGYISDMHFVKK